MSKKKLFVMCGNAGCGKSTWIQNNLNTFEGERSIQFEQICFENLKDLDAMIKAQKQAKFDCSIPPRVPAYVRLVMLYEKQNRYTDAINMCARAIRAGAVRDGSKGMMQGRLARLIKKSKTTVPEDIINLLDK